MQSGQPEIKIVIIDDEYVQKAGGFLSTENGKRSVIVTKSHEFRRARTESTDKNESKASHVNDSNEKTVVVSTSNATPSHTRHEHVVVTSNTPISIETPKKKKHRHIRKTHRKRKTRIAFEKPWKKKTHKATRTFPRGILKR